MIRAALKALLVRVIHVFFRRVELAGLEHVPREGPVIFAVNHPNALVDPLLVMGLAPRRVSFLAKAPLFKMPVIGALIRALDSIPVHRRTDQESDPAQNREMFRRTRELLERGGTIAIAPEGASHSDPQLRPLKTGAARIALGAGTTVPVAIVPVGLFYPEKTRFRSDVLVYFGQPIIVQPTPVGDDGEPPAEKVHATTEALDAALSRIVLEADAHAALELVGRVERILSADTGPGAFSLETARAMRQRLLAGYASLKREDPTLLDHLVERVEEIEQAFQEAQLSPNQPLPTRFRLGALAKAAWWLVIKVVVLLPLAIPGYVLHYPAYRLIGHLSKRLSRGIPDLVSTVKIIAAGVFFPITWLIAGLVVGLRFGWVPGVVTLVMAPLTGLAAIRVDERIRRFGAGTRALRLYLLDRQTVATLAQARERLRADLLAIADRVERTPGAA